MLLIKQISLVFTVGMLLSVPLNSYGQRLDQATEQWSEPQKIFADRLSANSYGAIADYPTNKVFYLDTALAIAKRTDGKWKGPEYLNIDNTSYLAKHPAVSRSGNLLYYIDWQSSGIGQWDLYVSRYDSATGQWGPGQMLPRPVNSPGTEWCAYAPNDTTLLFGRGTIVSRLLISYKTGPDNTWTEPKSLENHIITEGYGLFGITATRNLQKIYVGREIRINDSPEYDLLVSYFDSSRQEYSTPKRLNINVARDSIEQDYNDFLDIFPSVSLDGRYMVFTSTRDTNQYGHHLHHIYSTRLQVDQNGDSVKTEIVTDPSTNPSRKSIRLSHNYPNPFNPKTEIRFRLHGAAEVRLTVHDLLGREVATLVDETLQAGRQTVTFDAGNLSSGVYLYRLQADGYTETRKMMLVK